MIDNLKKMLELAQGRSEFVIAVVSDVRGFSEFSSHHESPDIAMFVKRLYLRLMNNYFAEAAFVKPTGDGLLIVYTYSEKSLLDVASRVLKACARCVVDFPGMFCGDAMVNFETPKNIGFGIARGPACCLHTNANETIDYSGHVLNLASRLNELACPRGIVLDGAFLQNVIPADLRGGFVPSRVFIRGIAENEPREIFHSKAVEIPNYALFPQSGLTLVAEEKSFKASELMKMSGEVTVQLKQKAVPNRIRIDLTFPHRKLKGYSTSTQYDTFRYLEDAKGPRIAVDVEKIKQMMQDEKRSLRTVIKLDIQYLPCPAPRK